MNETLIFFKIRDVFLKSIKTEAVFTKTEMNHDLNVKFRQNTNCTPTVSKLTMY